MSKDNGTGIVEVETESRKADTTPTKEFFIRMITRDITLQDCILDLLDNCIDGANRKVDENKTVQDKTSKYTGKWAKIQIGKELFSIEDNCGGITLDDAVDYAFHFGRRSDAPDGPEGAIGLYGIGMKRAIFKMGRSILVDTSTEYEAFKVPIDVDDWLSRPTDWELDIDESDIKSEAGTKLVVENLYEPISNDFEDATFVNKLRKSIARDYSFIIQNGFKIEVNGDVVSHYNFALKHGEEFKAISYQYEDDVEEVTVSISAGMAGPPPTDVEQEFKVEKTEYYGWFVLCNDRIVLSADKSNWTIWGIDDFPNWHPQYNGFMGIVSFHSKNPQLLPWTTTKRGIDTQSALYRRAIVKMRDATRPYIDYTNQRKDNQEEAEKKETNTPFLSLIELPKNEEMQVPRYTASVEKVKMRSISYRKPDSKIKEVAETLGNKHMSLKDVGINTFNYFYDNEVVE